MKKRLTEAQHYRLDRIKDSVAGLHYLDKIAKLKAVTDTSEAVMARIADYIQLLRDRNKRGEGQ